MQDQIYTICNIYGFLDREKQLLPHFVNHYRSKLETQIVFCTSHTNIEFHHYCDANNLEYISFDNFDSNLPLGSQDSLRINHTKNIKKSWYIPIDLDEFISIENKKHLLDLKQQCLTSSAKYVTGYLVDKICADKNIKPQIDVEISIQTQFPQTFLITRNIMDGCIYKVLLASPDIDVSPGHHWPVFQNNKKATHLALAKNRFQIYHYKWFGDILKLEYEKYIVRKKYCPKFATEQKKLLDYFDAWPKKS